VAGGERQDEGDSQVGERLLFIGYLAVIVLGLAFFIVMGLTHR
jgi:hypothetical protein